MGHIGLVVLKVSNALKYSEYYTRPHASKILAVTLTPFSDDLDPVSDDDRDSKSDNDLDPDSDYDLDFSYGDDDFPPPVDRC